MSGFRPKGGRARRLERFTTVVFGLLAVFGVSGICPCGPGSGVPAEAHDCCPPQTALREADRCCPMSSAQVPLADAVTPPAAVPAPAPDAPVLAPVAPASCSFVAAVPPAPELSPILRI